MGGALIRRDTTFRVLETHPGGKTNAVEFYTYYRGLDESEPVPESLYILVDLDSTGDEEAVTGAQRAASTYVSILSYIVNCHIGGPVPFVAWELDEGVSIRRFWQRIADWRPWLPRPGRQLNPELGAATFAAIMQAPERPRIYRALAQYHTALGYWRHGGLTLALAHLYMAVEALTPAVERAHRERNRYADSAAQARALGIDPDARTWRRDLAAAIRRKVICAGDEVLYREARAASDGLEHGYLDLHSIHAVSNRYAQPLFGQVREAIYGLLDLTEEQRSLLAKATLVDSSAPAIEVRGELSAPGTESHLLGPDAWTPPHLEVTASPTEVRYAEKEFTYVPRITGKAVLAEGVELRLVEQRSDRGLNDPHRYKIEYGHPAESSVPDDSPEI